MLHIFPSWLWGNAGFGFIPTVLFPCLPYLSVKSICSAGTIVRFKVLVGGQYASDWLDSSSYQRGYLLEEANCTSSITRRYIWTEGIELYPQGYWNVLSHYSRSWDTTHCAVALPMGLEFSYNSLVLAIENTVTCRLQSVASSFHNDSQIHSQTISQILDKVCGSAPGYAGRRFSMIVTYVVHRMMVLQWLSQSLCR